MSATLAAQPINGVAAAIGDGSLRYSTVWEDHRLLERSLDIGKASDVLVIASAGCNVFNLLLHAPRRLVAIDFNPAQTALVELKLAAIRALSHSEFIRLVGVRDADDRLELYERVRPGMSQPSQCWWDANLSSLIDGIEGAGRLDRFIAGFRDQHLSRIHAPAVIDRLLTLDDPEARRAFACEEFFTRALESEFRAYFTRETIAGRGRDSAQFRFVENIDVGDWFWRRLQWVATELPTRGNFYLERFLRGGVRDIEAGPPYLRPRNFTRLRSLLSRVEIVNDPLESYLGWVEPAAFDTAALSDLFEYLSEAEANRIFAQLGDRLRPGGRIAFWNLLVPREPDPQNTRLHSLRALSRALWQRDRAWFYRAFHVVEVLA